MSSFGTFSLPFSAGSPTSPDVPGVWPAALAGRTFMIDTKNESWQRSSLPILRGSADTAARVGESALNPREPWPRHQESWYFGSGQRWADAEDSIQSRYYTSKGIDPWTRRQFSLLPDTDLALATDGLCLVVNVGGVVYAAYRDGASSKIRKCLDITAASPSWSSIVDIGDDYFVTLATDGTRIWYSSISLSTTYMIDTSGAGTPVALTDRVNLLGYVKGRLMAALDTSIYNITFNPPYAVLPTPLFTHDNPGWVWTGFAEGPTHIYACGYAGTSFGTEFGSSAVYKIPLKDDGTGLDAPIVAVPLPDGEVARSIFGYEEYMLIGTDVGVRFAAVNADGSLTLGALIETSSPVACFEPQGRFVWYGLTNYDGDSTGLGRLNLEWFTGDLTPAYASDLMADAQGNVSSVISCRGLRVFAVHGDGVFRQSTDLVPEGTLDMGHFTYGVPFEKVATEIDVRTEPLDGSYEVLLSRDGGAFEHVSTQSAAESTTFSAPLGGARGERLEPRLVLTRATDPTLGPTVTRVTLKAFPVPSNRGERMVVPFIIGTKQAPSGYDVVRDPTADVEFVAQLAALRNPVVYQEGEVSYTVVVEDYEFHPLQFEDGGKVSKGTLLVDMTRMVA